LQHLGAEAGHFQHFLEGDGVQLAGFRHDARVGGVDAVDIGVDLAFVGFQRGGEGDAGGVGTAATQRGDVAVLVHALEAGDDHDMAAVEIGAQVVFVNREDARFGVGSSVTMRTWVPV
jgi:hypothetical protein